MWIIWVIVVLMLVSGQLTWLWIEYEASHPVRKTKPGKCTCDCCADHEAKGEGRKEQPT